MALTTLRNKEDTADRKAAAQGTIAPASVAFRLQVLYNVGLISTSSRKEPRCFVSLRRTFDHPGLRNGILNEGILRG